MAERMLQARPLTDGELIARSSTRPDTFHELFDRHFKAVHRFLARRVGRDRADDLASQTFTVAFTGNRADRARMRPGWRR